MIDDQEYHTSILIDDFPESDNHNLIYQPQNQKSNSKYQPLLYEVFPDDPQQLSPSPSYTRYYLTQLALQPQRLFNLKYAIATSTTTTTTTTTNTNNTITTDDNIQLDELAIDYPLPVWLHLIWISQLVCWPCLIIGILISFAIVADITISSPETRSSFILLGMLIPLIFLVKIIIGVIYPWYFATIGPKTSKLYEDLTDGQKMAYKKYFSLNDEIEGNTIIHLRPAVIHHDSAYSFLAIYLFIVIFYMIFASFSLTANWDSIWGQKLFHAVIIFNIFGIISFLFSFLSYVLKTLYI